MRQILFICVLVVLQFGAFAQNKGVPPPPPPQMPGRDGVMVVDSIAAGKSKTYNWRSDKITISLMGHLGKNAKTKINVWHNGKATLSKYAINAKAKTLNLDLNAGLNTIVFSPAPGNADKKIKVFTNFRSKEMNYNVIANLETGKSDTIIIKKL